MTETIRALDYDVFVGLDVDRRSIAVTLADHNRVQRSFKIPYQPDALINYTQKNLEGRRVVFAYEAGPTGYGLHDRLTQAGYPCLIVPSSMMPVKRGAMVKTNRIDSLEISLALRGGQAKGIRVPSESYRHLRQLVRLRQNYVSRATATKLQIKSLLLLEGIPFPEAPAGSQWSSRILRQLSEIPCSSVIRFKLNSLLETLEFLRKQAVLTYRELRRFCRENEDINDSIRFLSSIPGIGPIISIYFLASIGDWRNLKNVREIGSFLGLVPKESSTGDTVRRGSITHTGDKTLRSMLIEGAWSAIHHDKQIAKFYERIRQRHPRDRGPRKAIVAVARKLTTRMYAVLTQRRLYTTSK